MVSEPHNISLLWLGRVLMTRDNFSFGENSCDGWIQSLDSKSCNFTNTKDW